MGSADRVMCLYSGVMEITRASEFSTICNLPRLDLEIPNKIELQ